MWFLPYSCHFTWCTFLFFFLMLFSVFWRHICFPSQDGFVTSVCGYGDEGWKQDQPKFHKKKKTEYNRGHRGRLLLRSSYLEGSGGRGSIYNGQTLAQCCVCRAAGDSGRSPAWLSQSADEKGEIPWLIKNTQMNIVSPLTACVWLIPVASALFILKS